MKVDSGGRVNFDLTLGALTNAEAQRIEQNKTPLLFRRLLLTPWSHMDYFYDG